MHKRAVASWPVGGGGGGRGSRKTMAPLEIEICRERLEILLLLEKLVDHQLKIIRFTMMTYFSIRFNIARILL